MKKISIGFFGTPSLAAAVLEDIFYNENFEIKFVVTNPDKPFGRKQELISSPVKIFSNSKNIPVFQPEKIRNNHDFLEAISAYNCDYFVVVAYGKILPNSVLGIPKKMCINVHWSILPKYRGASPIQSALLEWEKETGVTIMQMSEKMDEGDMIFVEKITIDETETSATLFEKFAKISGSSLIKWILWLENSELKPIPQNHNDATYCGKIQKEDGEIDWNLDAKSIYQKFQAFSPWPGIFGFYEGKRIIFEKIIYKKQENSPENFGKIIKNNENYEIILKSGNLVIESVKPEWKKSQKMSDFVNGNKKILENWFDKK